MKTWLACLMAMLLGLGTVQASQVGLPPFAVIELFASEGCSSCPPADDLLIKIAEESRRQNTRIIPLSFQVDYWNNLGWPDPFSTPQNTQRQQRYARTIKGTSVYTPQMIVNGTDAFVGSQALLAKQFIEKHLQATALNSLVVTIKQVDQKTIVLTYQSAVFQPDMVINVALLEKETRSRPTAGENEGRTLTHINVVRTFMTMPFQETHGEVAIRRPTPDDLSKYAIAAYIQDASSMKIMAATIIEVQGSRP